MIRTGAGTVTKGACGGTFHHGALGSVGHGTGTGTAWVGVAVSGDGDGQGEGGTGPSDGAELGKLVGLSLALWAGLR